MGSRVTWPAGWIARSGLGSRWALVSLVTLVYWFAPQSVRLFYPLRLQSLGASDLVIGVGVGAASAAGLVFAIPSGYLLDRFNSQRVLIFSTFGLAVTTGAFAVVSSVITMIALMFVQGMFQMWVWLVLQEMITRVGSGPEASRHLSLFSLAWGVGLAAGPMAAAGVYESAGFVNLSIGCFGVGVLATVAALMVPSALRTTEATPSAQPGTERPGMLDSMRRTASDRLVVGVMAFSFVNLFVQSLRLSFYSLFLERQGVDLATIGLLLSGLGISSFVVRLLLPALIRRLGLVRPLVWSTWVAIVGVAMTPLSTNVVLLAAGAAMMGAGLGANPPITVQLLAGAQRSERGMAVALRMVANRSAQVVQPLSFGAIAAVAGLGLAFPLAGVLLGATTLWTSRLLAPLERQ